jgi:hypothetical protein
MNVPLSPPLDLLLNRVAQWLAYPGSPLIPLIIATFTSIQSTWCPVCPECEYEKK